MGRTGLAEKVVTLCGSVCSSPSNCGFVVLVAAGAAALAVLDGTLMLKAVGIMVGAGGNAGADSSSSNRLCVSASSMSEACVYMRMAQLLQLIVHD